MKKSIKLCLLLILVLIMAVSLFGCGDSATRSSTTHKRTSDSDVEKNFKMKRIEGGYSIEEYIGASENVHIPSEYKGYKIKKIEEHSFQHNKFVEKITVPSSIETIGDYAFACKNLKSVELNEGLKKIGDYAFSDAKINSITIPKSTEQIGAYAFSGCERLQTVALNEGLKSIGEMAFYQTDIREITIPKSVEKMGSSVFLSSGLKEANCKVGDKPDGWHEDWDVVNTKKIGSVIEGYKLKKFRCRINWGS